MSLLRDCLRPFPLALLVLLLTTVYLAGPARDSMNPTAAVAVLIHIGLGFLLIGPVVWLLWRRVRHSQGRSRTSVIAIFFLTLLCALTGIFLTARAAIGASTTRNVEAGLSHNLSGCAALLLAALAWWNSNWRNSRRKRTRNQVSPPSAPETPPGLPATAIFTIALLFALAQGALFGAAAMLPDYAPDTYYRDLTATNVPQAGNPLFPAGIRLQSSDGSEIKSAEHWRVPEAAACGVAGCHPQAYQEWLGSAHHFAGSDPFYVAVAEQYVRDSGPEAARWCAGCHNPESLLHPRVMQTPSDKSHAVASEGVGCFGCHATVGTPARTGNARFFLAEPQDYPFAMETGWRRRLHDFLLRVRPGPHQRLFLKPEFHRSAEFCSGCHRQSLTVAQNHYQFVRGPDEYGEWARGPASGRAARVPLLASPALHTCQECHLRTTPGVPTAAVSHSIQGGNTALSLLKADSAEPQERASFLRDCVTLDLFALRRANRLDHQEEWIAPLDAPLKPYTLHPGEGWILDVVVHNRGVGHAFPAGYLDLSEAWIEVVVEDANGTRLLSNGLVAVPGNTLRPDTHSYQAVGLDRAGKPIERHDLWDQVTTAYRRSIPAGGYDIARYHMVIPSSSKSNRSEAATLRLTARLRYRAVRPDFAAWALAEVGFKAPARGAPSTPPIMTIAETSLMLPLAWNAARLSPSNSARRREASFRFVRYGSGLLAPVDKPDIGRALRAFGIADELTPSMPEPWLGLGRAFLREPDLRLATSNFETALRYAPGNPAALADLGVIYTKQGQFERAIRTLTPLTRAYPEDGALAFDLGLALFRAGGRYSEAVEEFRRALAIDPDDYAAHFELKRCYDVLKNVAEARREDSVLRYLGEDRLGPLLVPHYLAAHPDAARNAQPFPVHSLSK